MNSSNLTYRAAGDVLSTNAADFWTHVSGLIEKLGAKQILELDLRASRMVDSVGLNAIVKIIKATEEKGSKVRMLIGTESLRRICVFTRLNQRAEIVGP